MRLKIPLVTNSGVVQYPHGIDSWRNTNSELVPGYVVGDYLGQEMDFEYEEYSEPEKGIKLTQIELYKRVGQVARIQLRNMTHRTNSDGTPNSSYDEIVEDAWDLFSKADYIWTMDPEFVPFWSYCLSNNYIDQAKYDEVVKHSYNAGEVGPE